jgi:hypothetical protein
LLLPGSGATTEPESKLSVLPGLFSGASRDRTGDLLLAKQALSQLSYGPAGRRV